jgi:hypothetical protein
MLDEEVPVKEYFRIRRADMRYIDRQLWKTMEMTLLSGAERERTGRVEELISQSRGLQLKVPPYLFCRGAADLARGHQFVP